jgi:hypothetical protein
MTEIELLSLLLVLFPLIFLSYAFLTINKNLGIIGFVLFQFLAIPQVKLLNYENIGGTLFAVFFIIVPSLILLEIILNLDYRKLPRIKIKASPIRTITIILIIIIVVLFTLTQISTFGLYLHGAEATSIQILLLASMTIITCTPFLEKTKI